LSPKLTVLDTITATEELGGYLADKDLVAYDSETTGVHKGAQVIGVSFCADESEAFYVIVSAWNPTLQALIDIPGAKDAVAALLERLKGKRLIMHNGVFDCAMAENFFNVSLIDSLFCDTLVLAHLLNENRRIGLKELGATILGQEHTTEQAEMKASVAANGGLLTKANYEMYKADPQLLGKYGAKDAWMTYMLFMEFLPELYEQGLDKFFFEEESMPLLRGPTYDLNTVGLKVDVQRMTALKKQLQAECEEAKHFIYQEITPHIQDKYPGTTKKNVFNIGSTQQLSWLLFGKLELEFGTLTDAGKKLCKGMGLKVPYTFPAKRAFITQCLARVGGIMAPAGTVNGKKIAAKKFKEPWAYIACDKKTLTKLAPRFKWIERLLEYQRKMKILSTYIEGIEERVQYGIIQPSFLQTGTTGGRYASRNPNFQNLPRDDKRIKECIIARPDKVYVGADYSQLEPRVFAYVSGDEALKAAFEGEDDFYSVIGARVYGVTDCTLRKEGTPNAFGVKYKNLRNLSKVIALASTYGATAHQLAPTTGKSIEATQDDIDSYFEAFPKVAKMMTDSHDMAKRDGQVTSIFGRPRRIPDAKKIDKIYGRQPHAELPYEARGLLNLAVNHRIQSTAASIVNRSSVRLYEHRKSSGLDFKMVAQVHDSIVVECNEKDAENVLILLQDAMENTVELQGVKLEAVPKIGKNLSEV
jgi:DNA polymerase I-like protein with 3'-5' exonuclease and polymerase domains